jgi:hypothetical protein
MSELALLVKGYLESSGFKVLSEQQGRVIADRPSVANLRDIWIVWTVPEGTDRQRYERSLVPAIEETLRDYPEAHGFLLASNKGGFSREFIAELAEHRVRFLVPIQFFDTPFKDEEAGSAASTQRELARPFESRVAQPYEESYPGAENKRGDDLADDILPLLTRPKAPTVHFVVGRAGIGKSIFFGELFSRLYRTFMGAKRSGEQAPRPMPMLPKHRRGAVALRTELVIDSFLNTELASSIRRETFEWLVGEGFAVWLLDGLDELYAGDQTFYDFLLNLLTRPRSRAGIVVCCRDSLLTTCDAFREFRDYCPGAEQVRTYRLLEWERPSKRSFAWLRLEGRAPRKGENDSPRVASFLDRVEQQPSLSALSALPYYCQVLVAFHKEGALPNFANDLDLVAELLKRMVEREIEKGLVDLRVFEPDGLNLWLEDVAMHFLEGGQADIASDDADTFARLVLAKGVSDDKADQTVTALLQFPFFVAGAASRSIRFAHEIVAAYLTSRAYLRRFTERPEDVAVRLGPVPDFDDSILVRNMAAKMNPDQQSRLITCLKKGELGARAYRNLLGLALLSRPERDLLRENGIGFEGRDLSGLRFQSRNLSEVSFANADLSNAHFENCDLSRARFQASVFSETRFDERTLLAGAEFGDLRRAFSLYVGTRRLADVLSIRNWVLDRAGVSSPPGDPCPAALQVRQLFCKYITPLGDAKRDHLDERGLLAGKLHSGAPPTQACVAAACQAGYLYGPDFRGRYSRSAGDKYAEMVRYVRDGAVSDGLGHMLGRLCRRRGCLHQLR